MKLLLEFFLRTDHGRFGLLHLPGGFVPFALDEGLIPAGTYRLARTVWHKTGAETYEITGVPGHSRILVHWGNVEENTEGCVLLGLSLGILAVKRDEDTGLPAKKLAVMQSKVAFDRFMAAMGGAPEATLVVTEQVTA
jgi:hypothetical protein